MWHADVGKQDERDGKKGTKKAGRRPAEKQPAAKRARTQEQPAEDASALPAAASAQTPGGRERAVRQQ